MSYSCTISFKQLPGDDVFEFLQNFKKKACEKIKEIARENCSFSPIMRDYHFEDDFAVTDEMRDRTETWAKSSVFKFRYFYNKDLHLLGIYGVYSCLQDIFDCSVFFQNSTDQDYEFDTWKGVRYFEEVAEKWKNASDEDVKEHYKAEHNNEWTPKCNSSLDYYRRSYAYDEIWKHFESTLEDDSSALHLSFFGYYDFFEMKRFVKYTEDAVMEKIEKWNKELAEKKEKKL